MEENAHIAVLDAQSLGFSWVMIRLEGGSMPSVLRNQDRRVEVLKNLQRAGIGRGSCPDPV